MTSNLQSDSERTDAENGGQGELQQFTPEQLRKAERVQVILYVVMAVFIIVPFIFMWLRKTDSQAEQSPTPQVQAEQSPAPQVQAEQE